MSPPVTMLTLAAAALELGTAGYYSCTALEQARHFFPQTQKNQLRARFSIDEVIWSRTAPVAARRDYLLAHAFASLGFGCLATLATAQGPLVGGLLFVGLTVLSLGDTWLCWRKYRALRN